jgi:hypothetical protein
MEKGAERTGALPPKQTNLWTKKEFSREVLKVALTRPIPRLSFRPPLHREIAW